MNKKTLMIWIMEKEIMKRKKKIMIKIRKEKVAIREEEEITMVIREEKKVERSHIERSKNLKVKMMMSSTMNKTMPNRSNNIELNQTKRL